MKEVVYGASDTNVVCVQEAVESSVSEKKVKEIKKVEKIEEIDEDEYEIGDLIESAIVLQVNEENQYLRLKLPKGTKNGKWSHFKRLYVYMNLLKTI